MKRATVTPLASQPPRDVASTACGEAGSAVTAGLHRGTTRTRSRRGSAVSEDCGPRGPPLCLASRRPGPAGDAPGVGDRGRPRERAARRGPARWGAARACPRERERERARRGASREVFGTGRGGGGTTTTTKRRGGGGGCGAGARRAGVGRGGAQGARPGRAVGSRICRREAGEGCVCVCEGRAVTSVAGGPRRPEPWGRDRPASRAGRCEQRGGLPGGPAAVRALRVASGRRGVGGAGPRDCEAIGAESAWRWGASIRCPPPPRPPRALGGRAGLCVRDLMAGSHGHPARAAGRAAGERLR